MHFPHPQIVLGHRAHSSLSLPPPPRAGEDGGEGLSQARNLGPLLAAPSPGQSLEGYIPSRCCYLCRHQGSCREGLASSPAQTELGGHKEKAQQTENQQLSSDREPSPRAGQPADGWRHGWGIPTLVTEMSFLGAEATTARKRGDRDGAMAASPLEAEGGDSTGPWRCWADFTSRSHGWVAGSEENPSAHRKNEDKVTRATWVRPRDKACPEGRLHPRSLL